VPWTLPLNLKTNQQHVVENAKKISSIKIVSYDWLEDSLQSPTRKPKPEDPYLLKNLMKPKVKEPKRKEKVTIKPSKTAKDVKADTPKRRIGITSHCLTAMQKGIVLTCSLQLILSSLQRANDRVSILAISDRKFEFTDHP
jgi:hypothetical protein